MIYLIALLIAITVGLLVYALASLVSRTGETVVARRLEQLRGEAARHDRKWFWTAARGRVEQAMQSLGGRFVATRPNLDALRATLVQAGYRDPNALAMYFAGRTVVILLLALLALFIVPLVAGTPTAGLLAMPYFVLVGWYIPRLWLRQRVRARQAELQRALPDTLDLLVVCVEAGLGLNQAMARVANEIGPVSPVMGGELRLMNLEIRAGTSRDEAFRHLGERTGSDDLRSLASMLIQADRFGTSVAQALRVQAETLRTARRQRAEEAAAKTTIKLVFPLVLFIFPALFVIILGPAILSIIEQMSGLE